MTESIAEKSDIRATTMAGAPGNGFFYDTSNILNALAQAIIVVNEQNVIRYMNDASEQFFQGSMAHLSGQSLLNLVPIDSPLFSLIEQARATHSTVYESGFPLASPRIGKHQVNAQAIPVSESGGDVVVSLQTRTLADKIDKQLTSRGSARSVTAMASMLAHEVKNPLSGIRGAAQLLGQNAEENDKTLTRLICEETDRICALVDRMEVFSDGKPLKREAVNIHLVLDRVRQLAENGFGRHVRFHDHYDPSLPSVYGNRDQLMQVFLNLVKNACEAAPAEGGEVILSTSYRQGVRLAIPGSEARVHLPLCISVEDNGSGIPEDIQPIIFDPFVTSKQNGSGLGMALVAKIINDHGGVIEFDTEPRHTIFRTILPMDTSSVK